MKEGKATQVFWTWVAPALMLGWVILFLVGMIRVMGHGGW